MTLARTSLHDQAIQGSKRSILIYQIGDASTLGSQLITASILTVSQSARKEHPTMPAESPNKSLKTYCRLMAILFLGICQSAMALPTSVLGNFGQPTSGVYEPISSLDLVAIPFVTDDQFTQLDGVGRIVSS